MSSTKAKQELPAPPYAWISWAVLLCYAAVGVEGAIAFGTFPWRTAVSLTDYDAGQAASVRVKSGQFHLCCIYILEMLLAVGPGWCAMCWARFDVLVHHGPYVAATWLCYWGNHASRWTAPLVIVLLTPANEGMFIAHTLGAPEWLAKFRRLFAFSCVLALWLCETWTVLRNLVLHWQIGKDATMNAILDQVSWGGIYYHAMLLRLYIKRWQKTRCI